MELDWTKINPDISDKLDEEYSSALTTQDAAFRDIEAKAKYWLSGLTPALVAVFSYATTLNENGFLVSALGFLSGVMAVMTLMFSEALKVTSFSGGHSLPKNHDISKIHSLIMGGNQESLDLKYMTLRDRLAGMTINASSLERKSDFLKNGYSLLIVALLGSLATGICGSLINNIGLGVVPMIALIASAAVGVVIAFWFIALNAHSGTP